MITIKENEVKIPAKKRTIKIKDAYINAEGKLTDDDNTDIVAEIKKAIPIGTDYFSFNISFDLPDEE